MRDITITLGGQEFTIHELTVRKSQVWRTQANELLVQFTGINSFETEAEYMHNLQTFLGTSLDSVLELVFAYSAELAAEREWILDNAYEYEIITAFRAIFQFAYPVDFLARSLYQAMNGLPDNPTSTNSVEANGASGQTNSTPQPSLN
ncbi:MAG: hypothetical protein ACPGWR_13670 [Ardenticatenaceae bacterium]